MHRSDRQAPRAMREERRSAVCARARACVRVLSAGVRHRRALLCTRERVLFIERHHSAPEILRGKDSRRAWEIEGILLARTRLSPRSLKPRSPLALKRAATPPKQEPGTHAPRPTPWRMAQAPAHSPCVPARPFREAFVRFQSAQRKSFQRAGAQEHRSTGASSRLGCQ